MSILWSVGKLGLPNTVQNLRAGKNDFGNWKILTINHGLLETSVVSMVLPKNARGKNSVLRYQKWFLNAIRAAHAIFESIFLHASKSFKSWRSKTGAAVSLEQLNHHLVYTKEMNLTKCLICGICLPLLSKTVPAGSSSITWDSEETFRR